MTGRVLVTARCRKRGHTLAELVAGEHLTVRVPHYSVGTAKGHQVVNRRAAPVVVPLLDQDGDACMTWTAMCADGVFAVHARALDDARRAGMTMIELDPVLR